MAQVFHRASGRAWRLRQRSLELWGQWVAELQTQGHSLQLRRGLLLLASDPEQLAQQATLVAARTAMGLPLALWSREQLSELQPQLPEAACGGLWSAADGQIDPLSLLVALRQDAARLGCLERPSRVERLEPPRNGDWQLQLNDGSQLKTTWLVVCAGAGTAPLLKGLGLRLPLAPVLGQALELAPAADAGPWHWSPDWPAAAIWQGINLVPRPNGTLWLGATLEPGTAASPLALEAMAGLNGQAPAWLQGARVQRRWQGLRMRPQERPAPWLEQLAPGLLLAGGHYRNGVLLAPATAEWLADAVETP